MLLDEILVEARKAGPQTARNSHDATFSDAAAEWLRYVEFDRGRRPATIATTAGWSSDVLAPLSGTCRCAPSAPSSWTPTAPTSSPRAA